MGALGGKSTTELSPQQKTDWLRLFRTENVGPINFTRLINRFGSAAAALAALPTLSKKGGRAAPLSIPSIGAIEDEIAAIVKCGGRLIAMGEAEYPSLLKHIHAAPPVLTVRGGGNLNWARTVGIVGARNASAAGQRFTKTVAADLGDAGYLTISGLARGIDAAAHKASLSSGTVAVLAGGLDQIYPHENIGLADSIIDHGGALLTEMPMGWEPRARDFPRRNRLVSGLSLGVVVIEAAKRSGSLITARLALEQNREVFAVPGSPIDPRAEGPNSLIRQGATLVTTANDIIDSLSTADPTRLPLFERDADLFDLSGVDDPAHTSAPPDHRDAILNALSVTPVSVDALVEHTNIPASAVQITLLELDIAGRLEWAGGQLVSLRE